MKAVFLDYATVASQELDLRRLESCVQVLTLHDSTQPDQVTPRISDSEIVIVNKVRIDRDAIESAKKLKFISLIATGIDNIDLIAARDNGIAVSNIRSYCTNSVVEHVFAMLLQLSRNVGRYDRAVRNGDWQCVDHFCMLDFPLRELSSMTLGIVGYGELGRGVHRMADAFGMQTKIARRIGSEARSGDSRQSLDEILSTCDVISLHCPITAATTNLISARELALMKPEAVLINTARGGLVDSQALVDALAKGRIAGAAIDVLRQEPPVDGDPLLDYAGSNLIVTPHIAWATLNARQKAVDEVTANVRAFIQNKERNRVA